MTDPAANVRSITPWIDKLERDTFDSDKTGITQLEKVTGKKLADLQADWKRWVAKLKYPPRD